MNKEPKEEKCRICERQYGTVHSPPCFPQDKHNNLKEVVEDWEKQGDVLMGNPPKEEKLGEPLNIKCGCKNSSILDRVVGKEYQPCELHSQDNKEQVTEQDIRKVVEVLKQCIDKEELLNKIKEV